MALRDLAREGVRELVVRLGDAGSEIDVCRAVELEAGLLRAEYVMLASMMRDDYELGIARAGELTARGRRLRDMVRVRVHEHEADGEGRVYMRTLVDLHGLRAPITLHFHYTCASDKRRSAWAVTFFVAVSHSHGPALKLIVLRVKARQSYPCPDGTDSKRVLVSDARLQRLGRDMKLGLQPAEVLQLLLAFDFFDEEWDVANAVIEALAGRGRKRPKKG
ncbi:hypothetical protein KFE25_009485 [Diacronema lutheri]|uniref:Uncharacterized protein n=1 Tax=Diacronema lutheri TaxID=2081491 RepID=A0A8J5Y5D3_DIALT|nr:hypothetical protein KFE25_009485 [Diacronema lutheri]